MNIVLLWNLYLFYRKKSDTVLEKFQWATKWFLSFTCLIFYTNSEKCKALKDISHHLLQYPLLSVRTWKYKDRQYQRSETKIQTCRLSVFPTIIKITKIRIWEIDWQRIRKCLNLPGSTYQYGTLIFPKRLSCQMLPYDSNVKSQVPGQ